MPDQTLENVAPGGVVKLDNAPAGFDDATFDALFPSDGVSQAAPAQQVQTGTPATQTPTTQTPATQTQTPPTQDDTFLKGERSVYKTREAALEGINQKDSLIDTLRQRYALATGIDPITGQPLQANSNVAPVVVNYAQSPDKYVADLSAAAQSGDTKKYAEVQAKFNRDSLAHVMPALQSTVQTQAVAAVTKEIPDFATFKASNVYGTALDLVPELKGAIAAAESNMEFSNQLPGLYRAAYLIGKGLQPQAAAPIQQTQTTTQTTQTPSATPRTATLPQPTSSKANLKTIDGIKATVADFEARGFKLDF